jgi:hypothetical protein
LFGNLSFVSLEFFFFFIVWHFFLRLSFSFGSQHLSLKHNNGTYAIFCLGVVFSNEFFFGGVFCPRKQICTFFFPYNYGSLQGKFLILVFVEALCVWG